MLLNYIVRRKGTDSYHSKEGFGLTIKLCEAKIFDDLDEINTYLNGCHTKIDEICAVMTYIEPLKQVK